MLRLALASAATILLHGADSSFPRVDASRCPAPCRAPICSDGARSNGGEILTSGFCMYYCAPQRPAQVQQPVTYSCGAGEHYEVMGSVDCSQCDSGLSFNSADSRTQAQMLLDAAYVKMDYTFEKVDVASRRLGFGKLWVSLEGGKMNMRLEGKTNSSKYGPGLITIVINSEQKAIYAQFYLSMVHEVQCLKYDMPVPTDYAARVERIQGRATALATSLASGSETYVLGNEVAFQLAWASKSNVSFVLGDGGTLDTIQFTRDSRIVKRIMVDGNLVAVPQVPPEAKKYFREPSNCIRPEDAQHNIASLVFSPLKDRSSALLDLLLTVQLFSSPNEFDAHRNLLLLSALSLPGEVAVMLWDPEPPDLMMLGGIAFKYASVITRDGLTRKSHGTFLMDVQQHAFHLQGEAKETLVGPLFVDVIARGSQDDQPAKLYSNFDLPAQIEHQCVIYDFPTLPSEVTAGLKASSDKGLKFFEIGQWNGEDCSVFAWELTRGRSLYIWVDMEAEARKCILRTEVRQNGSVLRSTDILEWVTLPSEQTKGFVDDELVPKTEWNCTERAAGSLSAPLARLGITMAPLHQRSIELQDALYSLDQLNPAFAVAQVLTLTGDLVIQVEEPSVPDLRQLPGVLFSFVSRGTSTPRKGTFLADFVTRKFRVTLDANDPTEFNAIVAIDKGKVLIRTALGCLKMQVSEVASRFGSPDFTAAFRGLIVVGETECNQFTYSGTDDYKYDVNLWYDVQQKCAKRLEVALKNSTQMYAFDIDSWNPLQSLGVDVEKEEWKCQVDNGTDFWHRLGANSAGFDMQALAIALRSIGVLPLSASTAFARIAKTPEAAKALFSKGSDTDTYPPHANLGSVPTNITTTSTPLPLPPASVLSEGLRHFSFSFKSTFPLQEAKASGSNRHAAIHRGIGEMKVDLGQRKFVLKSLGFNISSGIRSVRSTLIFRGDRQRLYSRMEIPEQKFQNCWAFNTAHLLPSLIGGVQPNPFVRSRDSGAGIMKVLGVATTKRVLSLVNGKRADIFISEGGNSVVAMSINDLANGRSVGVNIYNWSSNPISQGEFEVGVDWSCDHLQNVNADEHLAKWDLVQVFFPSLMENASAMPAPLTPRQNDENRSTFLPPLTPRQT